MSAETSYRAVAEHLPDAAVVLFDRDLRLQLATGTTLPDLTWCADHHVGRTVVDLVPAERAERLVASYRAAIGLRLDQAAARLDQGDVGLVGRLLRDSAPGAGTRIQVRAAARAPS
jgi:hypothetical protein